MQQKMISILLAVSLGMGTLAGCSMASNVAQTESSSLAAQSESSTSSHAAAAEASSALAFDHSNWSYDSENNVYWQIGVVYCEQPETTEYESLGIYVPGDYMNATANGDGTYTCTVNQTATIGNYTAASAPIVMPVNTGGYAAQLAPTAYQYDGLSAYLDAGLIYVYAGCRGKTNGYDQSGNLIYSGGAPWGVTDLKAAIRYLRYNSDTLPGDFAKVFTFGHSGGGAQSSLVGATGDSPLFFPYLESIGAAMTDQNGDPISDAIMGAMCWCPITSLDYADAAYEWMMGQYFSSGTRADDSWTSALSNDLSAAFASYINQLGLTDQTGTVLTLSPSDNGIYTAGSYYDYMLSEIERSLNNFLADNTFPYTTGNSFMADGGFAGAGSGGDMGGMRPPDGMRPDGMRPDGMPDGQRPEGMPAGGMGGAGKQSSEPVTYDTVQDYIASLNTDVEWVKYDAATNTATISSIEAFVTHCKNASKSVGAFDNLSRAAAENAVFGDQQADSLHFDAVMATLLETNADAYASFADWDAAYVQAYQEYLTSVDALGTSSIARQEMYNPMYYLCAFYEGYQTATPAPYWRIHTGINQSDTSLSVEMNLALALESYDSVKDVAFETVWEQGHTTAERTGSSSENFIAWVNACARA